MKLVTGPEGSNAVQPAHSSGLGLEGKKRFSEPPTPIGFRQVLSLGRPGICGVVAKGRRDDWSLVVHQQGEGIPVAVSGQEQAVSPLRKCQLRDSGLYVGRAADEWVPELRPLPYYISFIFLVKLERPS
jgi:hypothetical protein